MGVDPDGTNINEGCGSTDTTVLQRRVVEEKADLGIAFDGDGDRLIMIDEFGEIVDGDEIVYAIAQKERVRYVNWRSCWNTYDESRARVSPS